MSHQDRKSKTRIVVNHESLLQAVSELYNADSFRHIKVRKSSSWTACMMIRVALLWSWSSHEGLKDRFEHARKIIAKTFRWLPEPGKTYQGFVGQLRKWHVELMMVCMGELRSQMKQNLFGQWELAGYVIVAGDGSRIELARTASNEAAYSAKKKLPPLTFRVLWVHDGKQPLCLLTNVLSKHRLSDRQLVEIYKARWGVEVFFRTLKQTFGCRKLRSRSAKNAKLEADWALVGLWSICCLAKKELSKANRDPNRLSPAAAIKAIQKVMLDYRHRPDSPGETLWSMLAKAERDNYKRTKPKQSRNYPKKKIKRKIGLPKITAASKLQIKIARELRTQQPKFHLTA